ncbi:MAG: DUF885 family protein [Pseudomonadota bacterium]|nr:DUF885 family protein [Pseudomonadota bacterium]
MLDRRRFLLATAAGGALAQLAPALALADTASPQARLNGLLAEFIQADLMRSPQEATSLGLDTGPLAGQRARLRDVSLAAIATEKAQIADRLQRLKTVDRAALAGMPAVNYDTVAYIYAVEDEANRRFDYGTGAARPYVISQLTGAYQGVPDFLDNQHPIAAKADAEAYLERLVAFATVMDQEIEVARHDTTLGTVPPDFILDRALGQMAQFRATPADKSTLVNSVARRAAAKGIEGDYAARATTILEGKVLPALDRQIALLTDLRRGAVHDAGVWRLKDGDAYYASALKVGTTTSLTPDEVHQVGLDQARSLSARIDTILKAQGMSQGTVGARIHALFQDPRYRYANTDEAKVQLIADLNTQVRDMQGRLPKYFATLPKATVEIKRVPKVIEAGAPGGYYNQASLDGSRPGIYWINLRDTAEVPRWTLPTLTYHESIPGHHLQLSLQQEADLPLIRKATFLSAYGEGWALYAEQLADEMGVYANNPLGQVGYLQSALFRACRLVVDTGLHAKRWPRERAIQWMADNDGDQVSAVTTEVERYCVWPGQACSYKIGVNTWNRLRDKARAALGARFDIRRFHDAGLLAGAMPLTVLEGVIDNWIKTEQT